MLTAKSLLLTQTAQAFNGRPDMSLMGALDGITSAEADWRPHADVPSVDQLVRHIAWAKSRFCHRGFGTAMAIVDESVNDDGDHADLPNEFPCGAAWGLTLAGGIAEAVKLLERAHRTLTECLEACSDEALEQPIPTHHGKSAANFFWIMCMHDIYHAGQIRTRRTMYKILSEKSAAS